MRKMMSLLLILGMTGMLLAGCGAAATNIIEGSVWEANEEDLVVDCSDEVNKGRETVNSIGHGCRVKYSSKTVFQNTDGESLSYDDLLLGAEVVVTLTKKVNIRNKSERKQKLELAAKEVTLIKQTMPGKLNHDGAQ